MTDNAIIEKALKRLRKTLEHDIYKYHQGEWKTECERRHIDFNEEEQRNAKRFAKWCSHTDQFVIWSKFRYAKEKFETLEDAKANVDLPTEPIIASTPDIQSELKTRVYGFHTRLWKFFMPTVEGMAGMFAQFCSKQGIFCNPCRFEQVITEFQETCLKLYYKDQM